MRCPELSLRSAALFGLLAAAPAARLPAHSWHDEGAVSAEIAAARAELLAQLAAERRSALTAAAPRPGVALVEIYEVP